MQKDTKQKDESLQEREKLIVPEEIFAEENVVSENSSDESEVEASEDNPSFDAALYEQIAFFAPEGGEPTEAQNSEPNLKEEKKESVLSKLLENDENGYDAKTPRLVDKIFDFVELIAFTILTVFIINAFFFKHATVVGDSMSGTLEENEHLIISDLFYSPDKDDIVVFQDYTLPEKLRTPIVKRVIATEGDTVRIESDGTVYVNDEKIPDEHANIVGGRYIVRTNHLYAKSEDYVVPEGCVFLLGDNRNNSEDSRCFGAVDADTILGRVIVRVYPFDVFGGVD